MSSKLFTPLTLRSVVFPNRCGVPPMCMYSCTDKPGFPSQIHQIQYPMYADRGYGLIIQEFTAVNPVGRITKDDLGIWDDKMVPEYKKIVENVHRYGTKMGMQLAHSGRKGSIFSLVHPDPKGRHLIPEKEGGWQPVAPSAIAYDDKHAVPKEMTQKDIDSLKKDYASAAARAVKIGYDFVEIHCAYGYLMHQFLSPLSNHRTDQYGGSFENRTRLLKEIIEAVRRVIPATMPLSIRLSATDYAEGGWAVDDAKRLCKELAEKHEVDLIHVTTGELCAQTKYPATADHQIVAAQELKKAANIPVACVGGIWDRQSATDAIDKRGLDLVMVGRATLRNAFNPRRIARELKVEVVPPFPQHYGYATAVPPGNDY